jgi:hypothetical protein
MAARGVASYWVDLDVVDVPAFAEEPFMPPPEILRWRVNFYYLVSGKEEDYWKDQGKYWSKDADNFLGKKKGRPRLSRRAIHPSRRRARFTPSCRNWRIRVTFRTVPSRNKKHWG